MMLYHKDISSDINEAFCAVNDAHAAMTDGEWPVELRMRTSRVADDLNQLAASVIRVAIDKRTQTASPASPDAQTLPDDAKR